MDDFPSNSQNRKAKISQGEKREKVEAVAHGKKIQKSGLNKFVDFIIGDDSKNVFSYLWNDILVPAAKNMLFDMIRDGAEMRIFGEVRNRGVRNRQTGTYVSYDQISRDRDRREPRTHERKISKPDEVLIEDRAEAEEVLSRMYDYWETYGIVSLAEYYDLVGVAGDFTDNKWGWDNLKGSRILRVRDGYIVDLPRMIPLN